MSKKSHFPIQFDSVCRECVSDADPDKLSEMQRKLYDLMAKTVDAPFKCVACQIRIAIDLNGPYPGANKELLKQWGWVETKEDA